LDLLVIQIDGLRVSNNLLLVGALGVEQTATSNRSA
jgi:hypothetical protein